MSKPSGVVVVQRPWNEIPIVDCGEELVKLQPFFYCLEPHPYFSIGAPYGEFEDPWRLREDVVRRLLIAQEYLSKENSEFSLAIFDAWRPISVQAFMVEHAISQQCIARGVDPNDQSQKFALGEVIEEVEKFWAPPCSEETMPPPHSTGAAIDITFVDSNLHLLDMGGDIDEIGPISSPDYYLVAARHDSQADVWHQRRLFLANVMIKAGFIQHPNEWWHFSFGDQLWAWKNNVREAFYGACSPSASRETTF